MGDMISYKCKCGYKKHLKNGSGMMEKIKALLKCTFPIRIMLVLKKCFQLERSVTFPFHKL